MKAFVVGLLLLASVWLIGLITDAVYADYSYSREVGSYWELADKASSLPKKTEYLDKFVAAVKAANLSDSSALWLKTPDNSVEQNLLALESLQQRMHEIQRMNVTSFEYQQAIAQITAQEQGEAKKMLQVFKEAWYLNNHFFLWSWMGIVSFAGLGTLVFVAICILVNW